MSAVKQVIVMRKDLNMRRGKEIAQGGHAAIAFVAAAAECGQPLTETERAWLLGDMTKVCVKVDSEEALLAVYNAAKAAGLTAYTVVDAGRTEFKEPTLTCIAIGPAIASDIDAITGKLTLY